MLSRPLPDIGTNAKKGITITLILSRAAESVQVERQICVCRFSMHCITQSGNIYPGSVWIFFLLFVTLRLSARIRIPSVGFPWHMMLPDGEEISQRFLMPQMKRQWQCFWTEKIAYPEITEMIEAAMEEVSYIAHPDLEQILETEQATYEYIGAGW